MVSERSGASESRKRAHVYVSGRVQGVFFRESTRMEAQKRGVSGFVENLPDGRVEAAFEGEPEAVDALVAWCSEGPDFARVNAVDSLEEEPRGDASFEVR